MKQIEQNYRTGRLRVAEVPAPRAGAGRLMVATRASLISSGTEKQLMDLARASLAGKAMARPDLVRQVLRAARRDGLKPTIGKVFAKLDQPIPLGYSLAGRVHEIGAGVQGFVVGDRVACAGAGLANHAEFNAVPKNLCVRIPDGVSDEQASFVTLGAIALQGLRQAAPTLGERVVVMGLGLLGLLTVQLLKANGCAVLGFDPNPQRAELARELGADVVLSAGLQDAVSTFTGGAGADAVILTASAKSSDPLNQAGEISRMKGRVVVVGLVGMSLDRDVFYKRELDLRLSMSYGPGRHDPEYELSGHDYPLAYVRWTEQRNMEAFLALVQAGRVTPEKLITHRFEISDAEAAYQLMSSGTPHLAMLLGYPDQPANAPRHSLDIGVAPRPVGKGIGFIGLGNYARTMLLPALKAAGDPPLTGVVTSTGLSAENTAQRHGFARCGTDAGMILDDPETGSVFIATRHDSHADYAIRALQAGKNVFVEKPLALDLSSLDRVIAAAKAAPGLLTVGFNRRFSPMVAQAKAVLAASPGPKAMLYRINAGAIARDSWVQRGEGGGRIIGEICHFVDTLSHLAGSPPVEVQAMALPDHDDTVTSLIRFADGSTGTILYASVGDSAVAKEHVEVFAPGSVVRIEDFTRLEIASGGKSKTIRGAQDKGQKQMVAAFLRAVSGAAEPPIPLAELVSVTETTFAIEQALRTGTAVELA